MAVKCEFEEDAFQQAIDISLSKFTNIFTTPGRVSESILGYDSAFFIDSSRHQELLRRIKYRRLARTLRLKGVRISDDYFKNFEKLTKRTPKFKFNLFLQYKVPEMLIGHRAAQWDYWNDYYYRFSLRQRQLGVLSELSKLAAGRAIVSYASPAFISLDKLESVIESESVIENSNFVCAETLVGHHNYTYKTALGLGLAHSEVTEVSPIDMKEVLLSVIAEESGQTLVEVFAELSKLVLKTKWGRQFESVTLEETSRDLSENVQILRKFERYSGTKLYLIG